jgi:hypothetical protein
VRIEFGKFVLADHGVEGPDQYRVETMRTIEVRRGFRWKNPKIFSRQNEFVRISFTMMREHKDNVDAFVWMHDLAKKIPQSES